MSKETNHQFAATRFPVNLLGSLVVMLSLASTSVAQTVPPTAPIGLTATATTCGQVNLSWDAAIDNSGTGLKAYSIWRTDNGVNTVTSIGAARTWFDDTMRVNSSTTMSYYVVPWTIPATNRCPATPLPSTRALVRWPPESRLLI